MALDLQQVPETVRFVMSYVIDERDHDKWLQNEKSFPGEGTPLDLLGVEDKAVLRANVERVIRPFYNALGFVSAPGLYPFEEAVERIMAELASKS